MPLEPLDPLDEDYDPIAECERCHSQEDCTCRSCGACGTICLATEFCGTCRDCDECCGCFTCSACNTMQAGHDRCDICAKCSGCCECSYCGSCGRTQRPVCQNCGCCNGIACGCPCSTARAAAIPRPSPDIDISQLFIKNELIFHDGKPNKLNPSKRYVSTEIEVAALPENRRGLLTVIKNWKAQIVHDGSLPSGGFEINTAPAKGERFTEQIKQICEAIAKGKGSITTSCGLHVHVDARDFTYYDLRKLILLYAKIESALYRAVAPSRRDNRYCMPCGPKFYKAVKASAMPKEFKKNIFRSIYGKSPGLLFNKKQGDPHSKYASNSGQARYSALNIHSWFYRGTIECRMHHGTITEKAIRSWGVLWARLLDVSLTLSEKQIEALPKEGIKAILQVTEKMPETHTWLINRMLFFAKKDGYKGNMLVPGSTLTCTELRAMRQPEQTLDDTKEDNQ